MTTVNHPMAMIKLISKFPFSYEWELNFEKYIIFNIDYNKANDKIRLLLRGYGNAEEHPEH